MALRLLSSLLAAFALFLSPLAGSGGATAATPHLSFGSIEQSHCLNATSAPDTHRPMTAMTCVSACAPLYAIPAEPSPPLDAAKKSPESREPRPLAGIHPEARAPPPRPAPEM